MKNILYLTVKKSNIYGDNTRTSFKLTDSRIDDILNKSEYNIKLYRNFPSLHSVDIFEIVIHKLSPEHFNQIKKCCTSHSRRGLYIHPDIIIYGFDEDTDKYVTAKNAGTSDIISDDTKSGFEEFFNRNVIGDLISFSSETEGDVTLVYKLRNPIFDIHQHLIYLKKNAYSLDNGSTPI